MRLKKLKASVVSIVFLMASFPLSNAAADDVVAGINSRSRVEYTEKGNIEKDSAVGNYRASQRSIVSAEASKGDVTAYVGLQSDFEWSKNTWTAYVGEAWVEYGSDLRVKVGRLMFSMDEGRLMGDDDWNSGRVYDGLNIGYSSGDYKLNFLANYMSARPAQT